MRAITNSDDFNLVKIYKGSSAAGELAKWILNIVEYDEQKAPQMNIEAALEVENIQVSPRRDVKKSKKGSSTKKPKAVAATAETIEQ